MAALTWAGKLCVAGLFVAAAGILILYFVGIAAVQSFIGLTLLVAVALLILFGRWRWTIIVGFVLSLFLSIGAIVSPGFTYRVTHPANVGPFAGATIQVIGLLIALFSSIVAAIQTYRISGSTAARRSSSGLR